jgi:glucose-6-phosphate 1-dehydrogenase
MQVFVDTWRWEGVPFYLRSGKRMAKKTTHVVVYFKPTPHCLFAPRAGVRNWLPPNQIVIDVQPNEGIRLRFAGKVPGSGMKIQDVVMDFDYIRQFNATPPEAYATLLMDAMRGDQTLYKHRDEIEQAWRIVQPVLDYWRENPQGDLPNYAAGTWGPSASDVMMVRDGRHWHNA